MAGRSPKPPSFKGGAARLLLTSSMRIGASLATRSAKQHATSVVSSAREAKDQRILACGCIDCDAAVADRSEQISEV